MKNNDFFQKMEGLKNRIQEFNSLTIAFSGGVDSTFLLAVAKEVLGDNVYAIIVKTPVMPAFEEKEAIDFLIREKVKYSILKPELMSIDDFTKNSKDRCYICKKFIFRGLIELAEKNGYQNIAHGVNTDDFDDYRPGLKAADELGVNSPLADAGFSKMDIRSASREMQLLTAEKPAMACLASRIPYGDIITVEKLGQIERAESVLRGLGFENYRVRHHGNVARIEVNQDSFNRLFRDEIRAEIIQEFKAAGYLHVAVDLEGYSQGSMNRVL